MHFQLSNCHGVFFHSTNSSQIYKKHRKIEIPPKAYPLLMGGDGEEIAGYLFAGGSSSSSSDELSSVRSITSTFLLLCDECLWSDKLGHAPNK